MVIRSPPTPVKLPATALTPILMFTAKSQVDEDSAAGYDAGVDDYLTKPVHPAELVAHIKALLGRSRARNSVAAAQAPAQKSHMVGVIACRGGLGVSSACSIWLPATLKRTRPLVGSGITAWSGNPGVGAI